MKIRNILCWVVLGFMAIAIGGCKTTVKNYQDAYDVALKKKERDEERRREMQDEMGVDRSKLENVDDPVKIKVELTDPASGDNMELNAINVPFHREDKVQGTVIVVAKFKMAANAESLSENLRAEGFPEARVIRSGEDFYVMIAQGASPGDMAAEAWKFKKMLPDFPYVGIGEMMVAYPR